MATNKEANVFDERRADKGYLAHRHRLAMVEAVVDDHPPWLQTDFYLKVSDLADGTRRLRRIIHGNKTLVQAINVVNRTKGKTDTHLRPYVRNPKFDSTTLPVMRRIEKHNEAFHDRLQNTPAVYGYWDIYREWKRNERQLRLQSKYPWDMSRSTQLRLGRRWTIERMPTAAEDMAHVRALRPRVFLEFAAGERRLGRVEAVLYGDVVPATVANFLSLCRGDGPDALSYRDTPLFRVNPRLYCQGGDVVGRTGVASRAALGNTFPDENFTLQHSGPGVLSMCNHGLENNNGSQFLITFRALHALDGRNVVFGKVARGEQTLFNIENLGSRSGRPIKEIVVTCCGEVERDDTTNAASH